MERCMKFKDKVVVITGAAQGLGQALAQRCSDEGAKVVVGDMNYEGAQETAKMLADAIAVKLDVTKYADCEALIQAAVDKRKRREWVRIHIAECDAKRMARLSPALTAALASLSSQVRIIPMADDEPGTCIIEMPDEIIDASAATQIHNIRSMLADIPADEAEGPASPEERSPGHVPTDDPPGLSCGDLQPDGKD